MNNFSFLLTPAFVGFLAGMTHGIISHRANLPMSLPEQFSQSFQAQPFQAF